MTLDEAIQRENKIAEENQKIIDTQIVFDDVSISELYCDDTEVIEEHLSNYKKCAEYHDQLSEWLEELKAYRAIGTPEECMEAAEKQKAKKPIMKQYFEDLEDEYLCCPTCGEILTDRIPADNKTFYFHCMNCGQKFDWSDEE